MSISSSAITDTGTVRQTNEDAVLEYPEAGLWAVADGMGGHQAGDFSSQCLIEHLRLCAKHYKGKTLVERILETLNNAHKTIYAHSQDLDGCPTIGSTIVILILEADNYHCFWSGDSRCYLLRDDEFTAITHDHTEAQALISEGKNLYQLSEQERIQAENTLTHAIGVDSAAPHIDYIKGNIYEEDRFFLCSDGVNKIYSDNDLKHYIKARNIQAINLSLIKNAPDAYIPDNLSSIIVQVG